jgi:hypothetical protein
MDEQNTALGHGRLEAGANPRRLATNAALDVQAPALTLKSGMEKETELFVRLGMEMDRLRDSYLARRWTESLTIAQDFEKAARDLAFATLRSALGAPSDEPFSAVMTRVGPEDRSALEESWRRLKGSVYRLKSASGRLRYCTETMADTLNRFLEGIFPHRRGKIYTRHGTPTQVVGSLLIDKEL